MKPEPGSWQHDVAELLETLHEHGVPYLIVGGYAVAHAGHLRATKDVDFLVPRVRGASARLALALTEFLSETITEDQVEVPFLRFYTGHPGAFDIMRKLPGVTWATAWRDRSEGWFFGVRAPFLGIDSLIRNKRAVGRHIDLADVEQLQRLRRERRR